MTVLQGLKINPFKTFVTHSIRKLKCHTGPNWASRTDTFNAIHVSHNIVIIQYLFQLTAHVFINN